MNIEIPAEMEAWVTERARHEGFETAGDYLLHLVREDEQHASWVQALAKSTALEEQALIGLNSGPAGPIDMQAIRKEVADRLQKED